MRRAFSAVTLAFLASTSMLVVGIGIAGAATGGLLRVAYLAPAAPNVDIYVDGRTSSSNAPYKTVTTYAPVTAGSHTVAVRQAGSPADSTAAAQISVQVGANERWTVVIAGQWSNLQTTSLQDDTASPPAGQAEVRFVHTALQVPGVDVAVENGPVVFHDISFMHASSYAAVASGPYVLQLKTAGTTQVLFTTPQVTVQSGEIESLVGIGGENTPVQLLVFDDAAAAGAAPTGGADTGAGGASPAVHEAEVVAVLILLGSLGLAGAWYFGPRRRPGTNAAA
jgi:hypothetical protein